MNRSVGYACLIERLGLKVPEPRHISTIGPGGKSKVADDQSVREHFPEQFMRDDSDVGHLIFALKYDGIDLPVLRAVFARIGASALEQAVRDKPNSKVLRRLWFFYEFLIGESLDLPDTSGGAYFDALDPELYITRPGDRLKRYRVNFNLLGNPQWCPIVRRTDAIAKYEALDLQRLAADALQALSPADLRRAIRYLHTKETRSSFEIERADASDRMHLFVEALFAAGGVSGKLWWDEDTLAQVAGTIINDPRFAPKSYREEEVRVSESGLRIEDERVHFVGARSEEVRSLMDGLVRAWAEHHMVPLKKSSSGAIVGADGRSYTVRTSCGTPFVDLVVAGCLSFGFVFIHPFVDGNGRLHRLLLHRVLAATGFTPRGVIVPVSAAILNDQAGYDDALEDFSTRIMPLVQYKIDDDGTLHIDEAPRDAYRYPDLTRQVEALCGWFESAVRTELVEELNVLRSIDAAKAGMRELIALPDLREDLFLRLCYQSQRDGRGYALSKTKRQKFADLTDQEIASLEEAVRGAFEGTDTSS